MAIQPPAWVPTPSPYTSGLWLFGVLLTIATLQDRMRGEASLTSVSAMVSKDLRAPGGPWGGLV